MSTLTETGSNIDAVVSGLRDISKRCWTLDAEMRQKAISAFLAWQVRRMSVDGARIFLQRVVRHFSAVRQTPFADKADISVANIDSHSLKALHNTLLRLDSDSGDKNFSTEEMIQQVAIQVEQVQQLLAASLGKQRSGQSIKLMLGKLESRMGGSEDSLKAAAKESFDRLLSSLNPENAESYLEGNKVKIGPFYKGALLDALTEKYQQLQVYNEKGFLLRDFMGAYRAKTKAEKSNHV